MGQIKNIKLHIVTDIKVMTSDRDPHRDGKQPRKPPQPAPPPKQPPPKFSFRGFSLLEFVLKHWKHHDIGMQDQVRWGLRLSGLYLGGVFGMAGVFWLSIPWIDEWRRKEIMSGEFQRKLPEKEEKALAGYSPEMLTNMEEFSGKVQG